MIRLMLSKAGHVHHICHMILTTKIIVIKQAAIECRCRRFLSILNHPRDYHYYHSAVSHGVRLVPRGVDVEWMGVKWDEPQYGMCTM